MKYFMVFLVLIGLAGTAFALEPKTENYFSNPDFEIYNINEQRYTFFIPYSITNSKINYLTMDCPSRAMIIDIDPAKKDGTLIIVLPRTLLDSRYGQNDDSFFILVDGQEVEYSEIEKNLETRVLNIPFFENSLQIEIIVTTLISQSDDPLKFTPCGEAGHEESQFYKILSPLKQFKSGIMFEELQCKPGLEPIIKINDFNRFYCTSTDTKQILIKRGWAFDESKGCRNPMDCFDSNVSIDKTVPSVAEKIPTTTYYDPAKYYEIFTKTGPLGLLGVNENGDVTSGTPLLSDINCMRYANWLTEFQKKKIDVYEDYPRYPPWGNEIFPLVDYCLANGDLIKTIQDDKIHWEFQLENEN